MVAQRVEGHHLAKEEEEGRRVSRGSSVRADGVNNNNKKVATNVGPIEYYVFKMRAL